MQYHDIKILILSILCLGGDFTNGNGTGGESIYGTKFADENFIARHDRPGLLSMANSGSNTNGSQFFITFKECAHLNGRHVVFGRVKEGMETLKVIEMVATDGNDCPRSPILIVDCGQLGLEEKLEDYPLTSSSSSSLANRKHPLAPSTSTTTSNLATGATAETLKHTLPYESKHTEDEPEAVEEEESTIDYETQTANMSVIQKKLFNLRMKINASRKANKDETIAEYRRHTDPKYDAKQRYLEKKNATDTAAAAAAEQGHITASGTATSNNTSGNLKDKKMKELMNVTAEATEKYKEKLQIKQDSASTFGWEAFTAEADYRAYEKQLGKLPSAATTSGATSATAVRGRGGAGDVTTDSSTLLKYGSNSTVSAAGLNRLGKYMEDREAAREKHSRRRMHIDSIETDAINEDNAVFNKKIKRTFDKYTVEIRQNLERGTAL